MAKKIQVEMELLNKQYLQRLSRTQKQTQRSTARMSRGLSTIAKAGIGFFAARGIVSAMSSLVRITEEQQKQEAQLNAVLKSTKNAAGLTADEIKNMAAGLQQVTTFGDETILRGQNMLLTFTKIGKDVFPQATETMLNMSQAMGQDVKQTAIQLGKALNDPVAGISALGRVGVQLSDVQKKQIKDFMSVNDVAGAQKVILKELETQFGGSAKAARDTLGGALQVVKNSLGDVVESIGNEMTPSLKILLKSFDTTMKSGGSLATVFNGLATIAGSVAKGIAKAFIGVATIVNKVQTFLAKKTNESLKQRQYTLLALSGTSVKASKAEQIAALKANGYLQDYNKLQQQRVTATQKIGDLQSEYTQLVANNEELDKKREKTQNKINATVRANKNLKIQNVKSTQKENQLLDEMPDKVKAVGEAMKTNLEIFRESIDVFGGVFGQLTGIVNGFFDNESERIAQNFDARKEAIEKSAASEEEKAAQLKALEKEKAQATKKAQREEAIRNKAFGIVEATISTAASIAKALPNIPLAILSGALGAAQIAQISAQPIPSLNTGTMDVPSDTLANIHKGEIVIPKTFADSIREGEASLGGGGGTTINVQGSIIDTQGLMKIIDDGREKRAFQQGVKNYGGTGVYK
jgi:hypothetical protein